MIYEVACTRCGGPQFLRDALERGDVIAAEHKGVKMYYFPEVSMGLCMSLGQFIEQ